MKRICLVCKTHYKHGHETPNLLEHLQHVHQTQLDADIRKMEFEKDLD